MMKKLHLTLILLFTLIYYSKAQNGSFVVEVGSFETSVSLDYFKVDNVYETKDAYSIYRYWVRASSKENAEAIRQEAVSKGHKYARVLDLDYIRAQCNAACGYNEPQPTGVGKSSPPPTTNLPNPTGIDLGNAAQFETTSTPKGIDISTAPLFYLGRAIEPIPGHENLYSVCCIFFDFDKDNIRSDARPELDRVYAILSYYPDYSVDILAHTDARGTDDYNINLSKRRAANAKQYLTRKGIAKNRINTAYFGEKEPIAPNQEADGDDNEIGRQYNRRIEFRFRDADGVEQPQLVYGIDLPNYILNNNGSNNLSANTHSSNMGTMKPTARDGEPFLLNLSEDEKVCCIFFDFDKDNIRSDAKTELNKLYNILVNHPELDVELLAHTDAKGTDGYNKNLSERRASNAKQYLTRKGIASTRIRPLYYGEEEPIAPNQEADGDDNEIGRQYNRRIEFRLRYRELPVEGAIKAIDLPPSLKN